MTSVSFEHDLDKIPMLCIHFDTAIYTGSVSRKEPLLGGPVPGIFPFLFDAIESFQLGIFSQKLGPVDEHSLGAPWDKVISWFNLWLSSSGYSQLQINHFYMRVHWMCSRTECNYVRSVPEVFLMMNTRVLQLEGPWHRLDEWRRVFDNELKKRAKGISK